MGGSTKGRENFRGVGYLACFLSTVVSFYFKKSHKSRWLRLRLDNLPHVCVASELFSKVLRSCIAFIFHFEKNKLFEKNSLHTGTTSVDIKVRITFSVFY